MDVDAKCEPRYISVDRYVVPVVGHRENIFIINSGRRPTRKPLACFHESFANASSLCLFFSLSLEANSSSFSFAKDSFSIRDSNLIDDRFVGTSSLFPFLFRQMRKL